MKIYLVQHLNEYRIEPYNILFWDADILEHFKVVLKRGYKKSQWKEW